jgi:LEA14-like dessication related protein
MTSIILKYIKALPVLFMVAALASCGKPKDLNFGLVHNVTVKSITTGGITVEGILPIENPNGYRIKAQNADVSVLAGDKEIARIKQNLPVTLPGNSKGEYTINATISLGSTSVFSLMSIFNSDADLNINGTANISAFLVHRDVQIHQTGVQNYLKPIISGMKLF